jgi:transposase
VPAAQAERGPDCRGAGHPRDHPLQMEEDLAVAGSAADMFTEVMEPAGLNATELSAYCPERGLFPEQVSRWRQAAHDAHEQPMLTMAEQKELEKLRAQEQREIKALKKELQPKERAMAEMAAWMVLRKK